MNNKYEEKSIDSFVSERNKSAIWYRFGSLAAKQKNSIAIMNSTNHRQSSTN